MVVVVNSWIIDAAWFFANVILSKGRGWKIIVMD